MGDIDKLFEQINNEVLTEDVKLQMSVLFENALLEATKAKEAELLEKSTQEMKEFKESLTNQLDSYLDLFVEEFTKKNEAVITESVKVKTAEKILKTFSALVNDFHIQLDEKKIDSEDALKEANSKINELTTKLIESRKEIKVREKAALVMEASTKLTTDLEKAKLVEYAKGLPFDELFEKKVKAYTTTVLTEGKVKEKTFTKEKLEIKEDKPEFVAEKKETAVSSYLDRL